MYAKGRTSKFLINAKEIQAWMKQTDKTKLPLRSSEDNEEKRLALALSRIKQRLLKPYEQLTTEEEKKKYREEHPELKEVMQILNWIEERNVSPYLMHARNIKAWMEERERIKPPSKRAKDKEEKRLGSVLSRIRQNLIRPYTQLQSQEEQLQYREKHPELEEVMQIVKWIDERNISPYLINIRAIKMWMEERETTKPPAQTAKDREEKRLGQALSNIRQDCIKPYNQLGSEEEKEEYKRKHPELEEIMQIVKNIDRNNISPSLANARTIKMWMEERKTTKPPLQRAKDQEEKRLGQALSEIRQSLIKPYNQLETESEKEEYRKKHPGLEEIMQIVNWIDENKATPFLANAREIKKWMEEKETTKPPSINSEDKEERRLGKALTYIRSHLIKPYSKLRTEKEKEEYIKNHPELYEVLDIVVDIKCYQKSKTLAILLKQDLEKREKLKKAKELEKEWEEQLERGER